MTVTRGSDETALVLEGGRMRPFVHNPPCNSSRWWELGGPREFDVTSKTTETPLRFFPMAAY